MQPSSRTPEGDDSHCPICGNALRIEPSRPPGDAPCPNCGSLIWFTPNDSDSNAHSPAERQLLRAKAAVEANDLRLASRLLSMALTLNPSNVECKTALAETRAKLRDEKRRLRRAKAGA